MLDNRHVQYRFLNARAEAAARAKAAAAVVSFFSFKLLIGLTLTPLPGCELRC
jgi:hypothetical protein